MAANNTDRTIRLPDGRTLGYAEWGAPAGQPIFFFHGSPGSRLECRYFDESTLVRRNTRLITPDRPGFGLSDFQPRRAIRDWPADVTALAGALGVERFGVLGISGGAPYATACACDIPARLTAAAIVSGVAPNVPGATQGMGSGRHLLALARLSPRLAGLFLGQMAVGLRHPERMMAMVMKSMPPSDRDLLAQPPVQQVFLDALREAFRSGTRGPAWDATLAARDWGFQLAAIAMPVYLWQGEADHNVPPAMGRYLARAIPDCRAVFLPGEGHLLARRHLDEILAVFNG